MNYTVDIATRMIYVPNKSIYSVTIYKFINYNVNFQPDSD